ncbi:MAG: hypothetical protein EBU84_01225 [Actinobacteria bacterium]|nr:hypothetical protein [Actinomycetota bacterium]
MVKLSIIKLNYRVQALYSSADTMNVITNQSAVESLSSEGYFVTIYREGEQKNTLVVDCRMFFTDTDEAGGPASPFCIGPGEPRRTADNRCVACDQHPQSYATPYVTGRIKGSAICPLCSCQVKQHTLKSRRFRGIFRLIRDGPAEILPPPADRGSITWMTNEHMIQAIASVLKPVRALKVTRMSKPTTT